MAFRNLRSSVPAKAAKTPAEETATAPAEAAQVTLRAPESDTTRKLHEIDLRRREIRAAADAADAALNAELAALLSDHTGERVVAVVSLSYPRMMSASGYANNGVPCLRGISAGFFGFGRIYIPQGRPRKIAALAANLFSGEKGLLAQLLDSCAAAVSKISFASIETAEEAPVESALQRDIETFWPDKATHKNCFKSPLRNVELFMSTVNLVDFSRQTTVGPQATLAVGELKRGAYSVVACLPQAFIAAGSSAQKLRALGLPLEACTVPFFLHTGVSEQHGIAYLLGFDVPCCVMTSKVLDRCNRQTVGCRLSSRSAKSR